MTNKEKKALQEVSKNIAKAGFTCKEFVEGCKRISRIGFKIRS